MIGVVFGVEIEECLFGFIGVYMIVLQKGVVIVCVYDVCLYVDCVCMLEVIYLEWIFV